MDPSTLELSIVMPCLNEEATLGACIDKAQIYLKRSGIRGEILIADNGSTDRSVTIAREKGARVVLIARRGYGAALDGGIRAAKGEFIIMGDSDESYDLSNLDDFTAALRSGYDLVLGNRFKGGIAPGAMPMLHRYLGNPVLTLVGRIFFPNPCGDFHCGLRGFRKSAYEIIDPNSPGMEFASEMLVKAVLHKLKITEVPTTLVKDKRGRPPHLRTWRDGWRHLRFLLMLSPAWVFLYPAILLGVVGLALFLLLLGGPYFIGEVRLGLNTFLYAGFMLAASSQAVWFYMISKRLIAFSLKKPIKVKRHIFEAALLLGAVLLVIGLSLNGMAVFSWSSRDFGALEIERISRLTIPGTFFTLVGMQTIFSHFILLLLGQELGGTE